MKNAGWAVAAAALGLAACGNAETGDDGAESRDAEAPASAASTDVAADPRSLPDYFDCVREAGGLVIAAHRGGPAPGFPENALETLQDAFATGIYTFEIDVQESRDGVLFLLHDRTLGRTTTLDGAVADTDWAAIRDANLIDNAGTVTDFAPPLLTDILLWAKEAGAILELDRKGTTSFRNIVSAVRAAEAEGNVILLAGGRGAAEIGGLASGLFISAGARGGDDLAELESFGLDRTSILGWTGTREPDPAAWARLRAEGVEPAFGTLGRPETRLDTAYWADGDPSEYQDLVDNGLVLLSTDEPRRVAAALQADDIAVQQCNTRRP